jgi:hypothetical protein
VDAEAGARVGVGERCEPLAQLRFAGRCVEEWSTLRRSSYSTSSANRPRTASVSLVIRDAQRRAWSEFSLMIMGSL